MFGISMYEIAIIMVIALIVLGPKHLTEVARGVAKIYREIQRLTWEVRDQINLDSITSSPEPNAPPPRTEDKSEKKEPKPLELISERSGPDLYADLMEAAEKKEREASEVAEESTEKKDESRSVDEVSKEGAKS